MGLEFGLAASGRECYGEGGRARLRLGLGLVIGWVRARARGRVSSG